MTPTGQSLDEIGLSIEKGVLDPCELVDYYLDKINREGEKDRIFIRVFADDARKQAATARQRARSKARLSLYDGIPLAWKDNIDIAGKPTTAGIPALATQPAPRDAAVYERAARAGFICLGKTNMTELAFSGLGINPSYGTPRNPFDQTIARVPGGSSSGSAVAVAKGLSPAAIGTDTGGSIRIPAAWNSIIGLKTTVGLISTDGIVPLSQTLDTVGFLTRRVSDAASLCSIIVGKAQPHLTSLKPADLRLLVGTSNIIWDDIHPDVSATIEEALARLIHAGATLMSGDIPEFDETVALIAAKGNIVHYEGYRNWGAFLNARPDIISPDILSIFNRGAGISESDMQQVHTVLRKLKGSYIDRVASYSAVLVPTVVHIPPVIAELEADRHRYAQENALALRNTRLANLLGLCALSLPIGFTPAGMPVGLMLVGLPYAEGTLLQVAGVMESLYR